MIKESCWDWTTERNHLVEIDKSEWIQWPNAMSPLIIHIRRGPAIRQCDKIMLTLSARIIFRLRIWVGQDLPPVFAPSIPSAHVFLPRNAGITAGIRGRCHPEALARNHCYQLALKWTFLLTLSITFQLIDNIRLQKIFSYFITTIIFSFWTDTIYDRTSSKTHP